MSDTVAKKCMSRVLPFSNAPLNVNAISDRNPKATIGSAAFIDQSQFTPKDERDPEVVRDAIQPHITESRQSQTVFDYVSILLSPDPSACGGIFNIILRLSLVWFRELWS
jgi:hypothetical protein